MPKIVCRLLRWIWHLLRGVWADSSFETYSGHDPDDVRLHQRRHHARSKKTKISGPPKNIRRRRY